MPPRGALIVCRLYVQHSKSSFRFVLLIFLIDSQIVVVVWWILTGNLKNKTTKLFCHCWRHGMLFLCPDDFIVLMNRGTRGVSVQPLHLRTTQLPDASRGPWRTPDQATPHTARERRPGAESAAHHRTQGMHQGINHLKWLTFVGLLIMFLYMMLHRRRQQSWINWRRTLML